MSLLNHRSESVYASHSGFNEKGLGTKLSTTVKRLKFLGNLQKGSVNDHIRGEASVIMFSHYTIHLCWGYLNTTKNTPGAVITFFVHGVECKLQPE